MGEDESSGREEATDTSEKVRGLAAAGAVGIGMGLRDGGGEANVNLAWAGTIASTRRGSKKRSSSWGAMATVSSWAVLEDEEGQVQKRWAQRLQTSLRVAECGAGTGSAALMGIVSDDEEGDGGMGWDWWKGKGLKYVCAGEMGVRWLLVRCFGMPLRLPPLPSGSCPRPLPNSLAWPQQLTTLPPGTLPAADCALLAWTLLS